MAGPNDIRLRTRTDGNNIRLGEPAAITGTASITLAGVTLSAAGTVVTPAPPATGGIVAMFGIDPETWLSWDS